MKQILRLGYIAIFFWIACINSLAAQEKNSFDLDAFREVATRAEAVVQKAEASNEALEGLRADVFAFREAASEEQTRVRSAVAAVEEKLAALGPAPEEGVSETDEVAKRRAELTEDLANVLGPLKTAEEAYTRAENIIDNLDRLIRDNQTKALVELGPSPLSPKSWSVTGSELGRYRAGISSELSESWSSPGKRQNRLSNTPVILLLFIVGLFLILPAQRWSTAAWMHVRRSKSEFAGLRGLISSALSLGLPILGMWLLVRIFLIAEIFEFHGAAIVQALPYAALFIFGSRWISQGLTFILEPSLSGDETRFSTFKNARLAILLLGWVSAIQTIVNGVTELQGWSEETYATLMVPIIIAASICLWFVASAIRAHAAFQNARALQNKLPVQFLRWLSIGVILVVVLGPIALLIGYAQLANNVVFATVNSLALMAALWMIYGLLANLSSDFWESKPAVPDSGPSSGALFRVTLGFVLICAAVPIFALIWGARVSDISEIWVSLRDGISFGETQVSLTDFLLFILVFAIGYTITRLLQTTLRSAVLPNTKMDVGAQAALATGAGYLGIFLSAIVAITSTGLDLSNLAILAGALSVGVGFGLQAIVSNFVSGIILLIERPVSEGDWIEVGVHSGYVSGISVRSTTIETFDRASVIVPNSDLITSSVINYTHGSPTGRVKVPVGVSYDSDPKQVEEILLKIANSHPMVLSDPPAAVVFHGFGADSMDFEIRAIIRDVNWVLSVKSEMNFEIVEEFRKAKIEIPFPQRDINIRNLGDVLNKTSAQDQSGED